MLRFLAWGQNLEVLIRGKIEIYLVNSALLGSHIMILFTQGILIILFVDIYNDLFFVHGITEVLGNKELGKFLKKQMIKCNRLN